MIDQGHFLVSCDSIDRRGHSRGRSLVPFAGRVDKITQDKQKTGRRCARTKMRRSVSRRQRTRTRMRCGGLQKSRRGRKRWTSAEDEGKRNETKGCGGVTRKRRERPWGPGVSWLPCLNSRRQTAELKWFPWRKSKDWGAWRNQDQGERDPIRKPAICNLRCAATGLLVVR